MAVKFAVYEMMRGVHARLRGGRPANVAEDLIMGGVAGAAAAAATTPLDVLKTVMMCSASSRPTIFTAAKAIMREGKGVAPFFRGVGPRALSNGLNSAIFFCFFEMIRQVGAARWAVRGWWCCRAGLGLLLGLLPAALLAPGWCCTSLLVCPATPPCLAHPPASRLPHLWTGADPEAGGKGAAAAVWPAAGGGQAARRPGRAAKAAARARRQLSRQPAPGLARRVPHASAAGPWMEGAVGSLPTAPRSPHTSS